MQSASAPATNALLVVAGTEFLLSMVEARWASRNGDGRKMESQLEAAKANRVKELSALLTAQQRSQFANLKGQVQSKPMTNVGRDQPVNGKVKPEIKKTTMVKRDNTLASAAPIAIDKPAKKGRGKK